MRRAIGVALVGMALTGAGALTAVPSDAASAPALTLEASSSGVTLTRVGDDYIYGQLGVYAVAGKDPFKVVAKRSSYAKPIKATWIRRGTHDKALPTPNDFTGLADFVTVTYSTPAGEVVDQSTSSWCPNGYQPVRRRPSAPSSSPFPQGCDANPYTIGGVWGVQAGYAVSIGGGDYYYDDGGFPDLPVGTYTAKVVVNQPYRKLLHIPAAKATASVGVTVVQEPECADPDDEGCEEGGHAHDEAQRRLAAGSDTPKKLAGKKVKPSGPLPDLRSLPAWAIGVEDETDDEGNPTGKQDLVFSATVWNAGPGRLVVDGFRTKNDPDLMDAYQYFFTSAGKQKGYAPVGGMEWDARDGHDHWHFKDFATYSLLDADKKFVVQSEKEAFCLANTDAVDYTVKGANWKPGNTELATSCGDHDSLGVREVLDTGSGGTYGQYLPGQSFRLEGLVNGTYYIEIKANPEKVLYETKTSNNTSYRQIVIGGVAGARTVEVAKVGIIDEPDYFTEDPDEPGDPDDPMDPEDPEESPAPTPGH